MSKREVTRFLDKHGRSLGFPARKRIGEAPRWNAGVVEAIRQVQGLRHEEADPQGDWLARLIQEGPHGTTRDGRPADPT